MATKTVLEYVQACLNTMDSDQVDSISDTTESTQVAELLRDCYAELINRQEWSFLKRPAEIVAAGDTTSPTKFTIPNDLRHLLNVWYNVDESGAVSRRELQYLEPADFLARSGVAQTGKLLVTAPTQIQFYVWTDRMPSFYTSFDDKVIFCDAYKATVETSLVSSKVSALAILNPAFTVEDEFVPLLPEHMVPLLQATLNATSHLYFKQQASAPDEKRVQRQMAQARQRESKLTRNNYYANSFGRR